MVGVFVVGVVLLVAGALCLLAARGSAAEYRQMVAAQALRCADLGVADLGRLCEVHGVTKPGEDGVVTAPYSGESGVWTATKVKRKWREHESGPYPVTHDRSEVAFETESPSLFRVDDGSGQVFVEAPSLTLRLFDALKRESGSAARPAGYEPPRRPKNRIDEHYEYEELVLPAGVPMWVSGEVKRHGPHMSIGEPAGRGNLLLQTAPGSELARSTRRTSRWLYLAGGILVFLGVALVAPT